RRLLDLPGRFHALRFSPCGKVLAAVGPEAVSLRQADTGHEVRRFPGSGPVSFAAGGKRLAVAGSPLTITCWGLTTGPKLRPPLVGHGRWVRGVQFLTGGQSLASMSDDALFFWQARTGKSIARLQGPQSDLFARTYYRSLSPDGKTLAALFWERTNGSLRSGIGFWDTATGKKL